MSSAGGGLVWHTFASFRPRRHSSQITLSAHTCGVWCFSEPGSEKVCSPAKAATRAWHPDTTISVFGPSGQKAVSTYFILSPALYIFLRLPPPLCTSTDRGPLPSSQALSLRFQREGDLRESYESRLLGLQLGLFNMSISVWITLPKLQLYSYFLWIHCQVL